MSEPLTEKEIRRRMPYPIAAAWHRVGLAQTVADRSNRLMACDEIIKRTLVAFLMPDYLRGPAVAAVEQEIAILKRPTAGEWMALVRELICHLGQRTDPPPFMPEAYGWFFSKKGPTTAAQQWQSVVQLRNDLIHGTGLSMPEMAKKEVGSFYKKLRDTLLSMTWLQGYRPFRVLSSEPTRQTRIEGNVQFFVGSEEWPEALPGEWDVFLPRDTVYLTNPAGTDLLDVVPFLEVLPDPTNMNEHLYLMKEVPGMKQVVRVHDDSASSIRKAVRSNDGEEISFERWLAERPPKGGYQVLRATGGGIFRFTREVISTGPADGDLGPRFQKLETLGQGGMATVYRVRDVELEEEVALKVLNGDLSQDPVYRERFRREAKNMSRVHHPYIVPVSDVGLLGGSQPFLKMPVYTHGSLHEQIRAVPRPSKERIIRWAGDALDALQCIHSAGIVHRDVKPSNFLLSDDDHALLTDFGVALNADDQRLTRTLEQMGTLAYMAPEQRTERTVTGKADIYSLAIVLHELVTGSLPPAGATPGTGIGGPFGELIHDMGSMNPIERPTAEAALKRLRAIWVADEPEVVVVPAAPALAISTEATNKRKTSRTRKPVATPATPVVPPVTPVAQATTPFAHPGMVEPANVTRRKKLFACAVLIALFAVNYVETWAETVLRSQFGVGVALERSIGAAAQWFEHGVDFDQHDAVGWTAIYGASIAYFFLFPLLGVTALVTCARRASPKPLLLLATAAAIDYALTLPFYLFFPVPERWTYPESGAILLSDRWTSALIQSFRPFSGLNNCFPSFHVSATVILIGILFKNRFLFRRSAVFIGAAVMLSTFLLGIHWLPDIISGVAAGVVSLYLAGKASDSVSAIGWLNPAPAPA